MVFGCGLQVSEACHRHLFMPFDPSYQLLCAWSLLLSATARVAALAAGQECLEGTAGGVGGGRLHGREALHSAHFFFGAYKKLF